MRTDSGCWHVLPSGYLNQSVRCLFCARHPVVFSPFTEAHTRYCLLGEHSVFLLTTTCIGNFLFARHHVKSLRISFNPSKIYIITTHTLQMRKVRYNEEKRLTNSSGTPCKTAERNVELRRWQDPTLLNSLPRYPGWGTGHEGQRENYHLLSIYPHSSDFTYVTSLNQAHVYSFTHSSFNGNTE